MSTSLKLFSLGFFYIEISIFYFGWHLQWKYVPCPTISNPLEDFFKAHFSWVLFFASLALSPKDAAGEKSLISSMLLRKSLTHASLPVALAVVDHKSEIARTQAPNPSWSWHWLPFRIWPLRLHSWLSKKEKGPSLKSQSVQVCVFHEN